MTASGEKNISNVGRAGLVHKMAQYSTYRSDGVVKGIGDDAAVLAKDNSTFSLITGETFIEGVEFDLAFMSFHQIGARVISSAVSDIYAMNGHPTAVFVQLGIPNRVTVEMIDELYRGIALACSDYKCQLAGGDLTGSHNALVISVTACGEVSMDKIVYNSGAGNDEAICVTGDLGSALAGLKILLREKSHWQEMSDPVMQPDLSPWDYIVKRQLLPVARKDAISIFHENEIKPASMIDISQGLVNDLKRILSASGKGAKIYQSVLPIDLQTRKAADEMKEDVDKYALYGGEDFELLFTVDKKVVDKLASVLKNFTVIGKITPTPGQMVMQTAEGDVVVFEDE